MKGLLVTVMALTAVLITVGCVTLPDWVGGAIGSATNVVSTTVSTTTTTTTTAVPENPYVITKVTASMIYWKGPSLTWSERSANEVRDLEDRAMIERAGGPCCGEVHLYRADGRGGKFDHLRRDSKSRDWLNIHGGYGVFKTLGEPENGELCTFKAKSYDGTQWVTFGTFNWVR